MTLSEQLQEAPEQQATQVLATTASPRTVPRQASGLQGVGHGLTLLALLLVGYVVYLYAFSQVQEARMQHNLYATLRGQLALGVAPLGSPAQGSPVAILDIPRLGLHAVVVEGTTAGDLTRGPGHRRDSPLPGQTGVSEIYGRRATFGAPFAHLPQLWRGDKITVTTGQGVATYAVVAYGDAQHPVRDDQAPNRMVLITADSSWVPKYWIEVDTVLTSAAQPDPGGRPYVSPAEMSLHRDDSTLVLAMVWGLALAVTSVTATVAAARWSRWPAYLATAPVLLAVVWNLYENLSALQPNLF